MAVVTVVAMAYLQEGNRGGKILINDGYRYQRNKTKTDKIYWRCWRTTCSAFLHTSVFDIEEDDPNIQILQVGDHNHADEGDLIATTSTKQHMLQAVEDDPSKPVRRVYDEVIRDAENDDQVPQFNSVRSRLQRRRASLMPPIPQTVEDVVIHNEWAETWRGEDFMCHQDNDWGVLMFGTDRNFAKLSRCRDVYIDGTFKSCPRPYAQFVTIHGKYMDRVVPLVMCLMTGKTVAQYRHLITQVKRKVRRVTGHRWRPQRVITDFESSLLLAIQAELPNSLSSACYFHFCQSLWRKVQELGLSGQYMRHGRLRKAIRKIMSIGYLPLALVRNNFRLLVTNGEMLRLRARYHGMGQFIDYVRRNYVEDGCQFPPQLWNVFERTSDNRTNNFVEGKLCLDN